MAKIQLEVPDDLHIAIKQKQLARESKGEKVNLKDLYIELIRKAVESK